MMKWTKDLCDRVSDLYHQGLQDSEIAQSMGIRRVQVCRIRYHLGLARANTRPKSRACEYCASNISPGRYRRHVREMHGILLDRRNPRKHVNACSMLSPRNGNFDSRRALEFLIDNWRAA